MVKSSKRRNLEPITNGNSLPEAINALLKISLEDIKEDAFKPLLCVLENKSDLEESLKYTYNRLIKGSCSVKESTQKAFVLAFEAVCKNYSERNTPMQMVELVLSILTPESLYGTQNIARSQETGYYLGKLGCFSAVFKVYSSQLNEIPQDTRIKLMDEFLLISKKRPSLCLLSFDTILKLSLSDCDIQRISERFGDFEVNADLIWFVHMLDIPRESLPEKIAVQFPTYPLISNTERIIDLLAKDALQIDDLHPLWKALIGSSVEINCIDSLLKRIDGSLIGSESNAKRLLGLQVFAFALKQSPAPSQLPRLIDAIKNYGAGHKKTIKHRTTEPLVEIIELMASSQMESPIIDEIMMLPNFRTLPGNFYATALASCERRAAYISFKKSAIFSSSSTPVMIATHLDDIFEIFDLEPVPAEEKVLLWNDLMDLTMDIVLNHKEVDQKLPIARMQSLLMYGIHVGTMVQALSKMDSLSEKFDFDDPILADSFALVVKMQKRLRKSEFKTDSRVSCLLSYLTFCKFWLQIDSLLVVDGLEDIDNVIKNMNKSSTIVPVDFLVDLLLRLLSNGVAFGTELSGHLFRELMGHLNKPSLKLLSDVLCSGPEGASDGNLLEDMDSEYESDSDMDASEEELESIGDKRGFVLSENNESEIDDEDVFLDDADETELAAFDAKLSEIFRLKKEKSSSVKLSAQALIHFKSRVMHWIRFLLHCRSTLPIELKAFLTFELLVAMPKNMKDQSISICESIVKTLKGLGKAEDEYDTIDWNKYIGDIFDLVLTSYWEHQIQWVGAFAVISWILKNSPQITVSPHLVNTWSFLLSSKAAQRSRFASFLNLFAMQYPSHCLYFFESSDFFEKLSLVSMHCRLLLLQFIQSSVANSKEYRNWETLRTKWFSYVVTFVTSSEFDIKSSSWKSHLSTCKSLAKKLGPMSINDFQLVSSKLDKNSFAQLKP